DLGVQQLPTIPSSIDVLKANVTELLAKISKLPLEQLSAQLLKTIEDADGVLKAADGVVKEAGKAVTSLQPQVKPMAVSVIGASDQANQMLREARERLELRPGEPLQNLNLTLTEARDLIVRLNQGLPSVLGPAVQALATIGGALSQGIALIQAAQR